jgi:hypothetical protein
MVEPLPCLILTEQLRIIQLTRTAMCDGMRKTDIRDRTGIDSCCKVSSDQGKKADFGHSKGIEYMKAAGATRGTSE